MVCSVDGCDKKARTRGWCSAHYERWRRNGDPGPAGDARRRESVPCSVEDCDDRAAARGWCKSHYANWRRTGAPIPQVRPHYGSNEPRMSPNGYRLVYEPKHPLAMAHGYVYEHRMIAWDAGILTDSRHVVHHRNGDKLDNRPENLEATTQGDHVREHVSERGYVDNQYGRHPVTR